jgi:hypothetical protein
MLLLLQGLLGRYMARQVMKWMSRHQTRQRLRERERARQLEKTSPAKRISVSYPQKTTRVRRSLHPQQHLLTLPVIASLTSKANAIKMLHSRIQLIIKYLEQLPPSHLNISPASDPSTIIPLTDATEINHTILRSIHALVNRLPLLIPVDYAAFEKEVLMEKTDVQLVALLGSLSRSVNDVRRLGRKYAVGEPQRTQKKGPFADDPFDGLDTISEGPLSASKRHQHFMA